MESFSENYDLENLIKQPSCYENPNSPTCIDLVLVNVTRRFQNTSVLEIKLYDFHLMALIGMRKSIKNFQSKIIH